MILNRLHTKRINENSIIDRQHQGVYSVGSSDPTCAERSPLESGRLAFIAASFLKTLCNGRLCLKLKLLCGA
jgi:hypothetical protein